MSLSEKTMMKTKEDIETLEKTRGQLQAVHREISILSKKAPNDAVDVFKLALINTIIVVANNLLGSSYTPLEGFEKFDEDDTPSTSDVAFVIAQYLEEIERFRSDHIVVHLSRRVYVLSGKPSDVRATK